MTFVLVRNDVHIVVATDSMDDVHAQFEIEQQVNAIYNITSEYTLQVWRNGRIIENIYDYNGD